MKKESLQQTMKKKKRIIGNYYEQWYGNKIDNLEQMDRFLEKFKFPRLNQEEIEIINNPTTSTEIKVVIKKSPPKQKPRARWLHRGILLNIQRTANAYFSETIPKNCSGRNTSKLILWGHHHPDIKTRQRQHKKENYKPILLINIDAKILNKILANRIQQHIKNLIHHDQIGFIPGMQGFFSISNQSVWYTISTNWKVKTIWSSQ